MKTKVNESILIAALKSVNEKYGYKYGSAWLYQPLPEDVLQTILDVLQADIKDI